jgi:hypothetical protein
MIPSPPIERILPHPPAPAAARNLETWVHSDFPQGSDGEETLASRYADFQIGFRSGPFDDFLNDIHPCHHAISIVFCEFKPFSAVKPFDSIVGKG